MKPAHGIDFSDIQGLVVRGYGNLPDACFLLLAIEDARKARGWLENLIQEMTFADYKPDTLALNLALSHHGLQALELPEFILEQFSDEFRAGMHTPHKRRILGDEGENAPELWDWGGPGSPPVDLLLLCYAADGQVLEATCNRLRKGFEAGGLREILRLDTRESVEFKEHFGFRDSLSQPYIAEFSKHYYARSTPVPLGEFLLGYPNGYCRYTQRPLIDHTLDPRGILPPDPEGSTAKDLGKNGTYLVFRQLAQDVKTFWSFMLAQAREQGGREAEAIELASKMVGRWPSGTPLVKAPEADQPDQEHKNDFAYHREDPQGLRCPIGAHIRRTHPRDSLEPEPGSPKSVEFTNRHRILRRGRTYGKPFHPTMDPQTMLRHLEEGAADAPRGLHFICLNANICRQFEFVQHTWANNPTFNGLYHDPDPLLGPRYAFGCPQDRFTVQQEPLRRQVRGLPDFVHVRGGGYFFLPSRRALHYVATQSNIAIQKRRAGGQS